MDPHNGRMRSYKKVQQEVFEEAGLDPKWVDKMQDDYSKITKQGWTRLMDKMRNEVMAERAQSNGREASIFVCKMRDWSRGICPWCGRVAGRRPKMLIL